MLRNGIGVSFLTSTHIKRVRNIRESLGAKHVYARFKKFYLLLADHTKESFLSANYQFVSHSLIYFSRFDAGQS